jgi:hypothetical protein
MAAFAFSPVHPAHAQDKGDLVGESPMKLDDGSLEASLFWTSPAEVVQLVELVNELPCGEHPQPCVRIHVEEPSSNDQDASSVLRTIDSQPMQASRSEPIGQTTLMLRSQRIGEWLARVIADEGWYSEPSTGGEKGDRLCYELERKCHRVYPYQNTRQREQREACEDMDDFC